MIVPVVLLVGAVAASLAASQLLSRYLAAISLKRGDVRGETLPFDRPEYDAYFSDPVRAVLTVPHRTLRTLALAFTRQPDAELEQFRRRWLISIALMIGLLLAAFVAAVAPGV